MEINDPNNKRLYDVGWGTPTAGDIETPLENVGQTLAEVSRRVADNIEDKLRLVRNNMQSLVAKLKGTMKQWCEECQVTLNACDKMVTGKVEDKLLCIRYALDQVCDKCPEAKNIVFGAIGDNPIISNYGGPVSVSPITSGAVPSAPPVSDFPVSPPIGDTEPLPFSERPITVGTRPGPPVNDPPPIIPTLPKPLPPVVTDPFGINPPVFPPPPRNDYCIVHSPRSNCRYCIPRGNLPLWISAGSVLVGCGFDPQTCGQIVQAWNLQNCNRPQPYPPPTQPYPQPPIQPYPPPPQPPVNPNPCVVCNVCSQCQPTTKPCPECPKTKFCAWRSQDGSRCYILPEASAPLNASDIKMACSEDVASLTSQIQYGCQQQTQPSPPSNIQPIEIGSGQLLCSLLSYKPGQMASQFITAGTSNPIQLLLFGPGGNLADALKDATKDCDSNNPLKFIWGCLRKSFLEGLSQIDGFLTKTLGKTGCTSQAFINPTLALIIWQIVEKYICGDIPQISQPLKYTANAACPVLFPSQQDASIAWLRGQISDDVYRTWVQQNNYCLDPWNQVTLANQAHFTPFEAVQALRRGLITQTEYEKQIRRNSWLGSNAPRMWQGLTEFVPPITDLVRFMVRDVEDPAIYNRFRLDEGFGNKWQGKAKQWGAMQGISDEVALRYWRAHWTIPAPGQLFEMYHRSRGDDPSSATYVGYDTLRDALQYQDIAPFWVDRLLNTTYALLRLVDIRRAYELGALDDGGIFRQFVRRGYTDEDATTLVAYYAKQKQVALLRNAAVRSFERGEISAGEMEFRLRDLGATDETVARAYDNAQPKLLRSRVVKLYETWQTTEGETRAALNAIGAAPATIETAIRLGRRIRFKSSRMRCLNAIRKRFLYGELLVADLRVILINAGASSEEADELIPLWECERAARGKEFTAAQLCGYLEQGLIGPEIMFERLQRLGWRPDDAYIVIASCGMKIDGKRKKEFERLEAQRKREADKVQRALDKAARAAAAREEKNQRRKQMMEDARQRREMRLEDAIARLAVMTGSTVRDTGTLIRSLWNTITDTLALVPDERIHVIVRAIERGKPKTLADAESMILDLANEADALASVSEDITE